MPKDESCSCGAPVVIRDWCRKCYRRLAHHGLIKVKPTAKNGEPLALIVEAVGNRDRGNCWTDWPFAHDSGGYPHGTFGKVGHVAMERDGRLRPASGNDYMLHSCDTRACWNPDHLSWGTHAQNCQEAWDRTRPRGFKLTESDVVEIRASDETIFVLGERYGVAFQTISDIRRRKTWKHI